MTAPSGIWRGTIIGAPTPTVKPPLSGLCDMGAFPFVAGAYPWGGVSGVSPYTLAPGSGDYSTVVGNVDIPVFWKDLQPGGPGETIDLATVPTVTYISAGPSDIGTGVARGLNAAQALATAAASGHGVHFRVIGGFWAPQWVQDLPVTNRAGQTLSGQHASLVSSAGKSVPPFWTAKAWDPKNPLAGFTGAYWGLVSQLAKQLDTHPSVRAVSFSGSLTQDTAEPLIRALGDDVTLANAWWYGLGESISGAGDDTDTPAVYNLIPVHMQAFRYTPMSFSMGPNRRPSVQAIVADLQTTAGSNVVTSPGGHLTSGMNGCLVAGDPANVAAGTHLLYTSATSGQLVKADLTTHVNAVSTRSAQTLGVFNSTSNTSDTAIAQTIGTWARTNYGPMFIGGTTSFQANDWWLRTNPHTNWGIANPPFFGQGVVTGNLFAEQQRLAWSTDGGATTLGIPTLGGSIKLHYAAQISNAISLSGGTAAALATNINTEIASGPLTTLKAEGVVASASGTHFVLLTWPAPPVERADDVIVMDSSAVTGAGGLASYVTVTQYEDTLVKDIAAARLAGFAWFEMHRGYESSPQPDATPAEMASISWPAMAAWASPNRYLVTVPKLAGGQHGPMQACEPGDGSGYQPGDQVTVGFLQNGTTGQMVILGKLLS